MKKIVLIIFYCQIILQNVFLIVYYCLNQLHFGSFCVFFCFFLSQICKWTQFRPQLHSLACWESLIYPNYSSVKKLQALFSIWYYCFSSEQVVVSASLEFLNKRKKSKHLVIFVLIDFLPIFLFIYFY